MSAKLLHNSILPGVLLALAIFLLAIFVPVGISAATLYVVVILIGLLSQKKQIVLQLLILCTVLALAGLLFAREETILWMTIANLVIGMIAFWATGLIGMKRIDANESLRESERLHRDVLDHMLEGAQIIGFDWRYLYVNETVARQGHQTREGLIGHTMMEVYPGIENTDLFVVLRQCMQERTAHQMHNEFVYPDGDRGWFELSIQPIPEGLFILSYDITARKLAEEKFQLAVEASPNAIMFVDKRGQIVMVNSQMQKFFGYERSEMIGMQVDRLVPVAQQVGHEQHRNSYFADPQERPMGIGRDLFGLRKDGGEFPVEIGLTPISVDDDPMVMTTVVDITGRKQAEDELRRMNAVLEQRVDERTESLKTTLRYTQSLYEVVKAVISFDDLPDVLQSIAETVAQTLAADRVIVITFEHEAQRVIRLARAGPGVGHVVPTVSYDELMEGLSGWVLRELRPAFSSKDEPDPRESPAVQQRRRETNCGCIVVFPLLYQGEVLGTMTVINTPEQPDFSEWDVSWMSLIADQAASAISMAQLYDQLKKANLQLETQGERLQKELAERTLTEEALRRSEERFRLLTWATTDAVWDWDLLSNYIDWGTGLQKVFHYAPENVQPNLDWWFEHIHPDDRAMVDRSIRKALDGGLEFWSKEYRFQYADGTYANIMDRGYILRNDVGKPHRMIGAMIDITARRQTEQALLESETRYRQIVETAGDIIYWVNVRGRLTYVNPTALRIMGYETDDDVLHHHYLEFVHPAWREKIKNVYNRQFIEKTLTTYHEFLALTRAGHEIWLGQTVQLAVENNQVVGFQAIARDITERRQAEDVIRRQTEMLARLHQITLELFKDHDDKSLFRTLVNLASDFLDAAYVEILLLENDELVVRAATANLSYLIDEHVTREMARLSWQSFDTRQPVTLTDYSTWAHRRDVYNGSPLYAAAELPILNAEQCLGVLSLGRDRPGYEFTPDQIQHGLLLANLTALVLQNADLKEALREQSIRDPLTGLFNRRYMEETLKREISRVTRQLHPLGVIMLDVDHFKKFNDTHGHSAGDALLHEMGWFLQKQIRGEDVACRYGGEEFILIMPDITLEVGLERAEQIRHAVIELRLHDNDQHYEGITLSLGVALYPQHGKTIDAVIRAADNALYRAKQAGRNRVMVAEDVH